MSSFYHGDALELSIFGQSHSPAIGVTLSGLPAGFSIDMDELGAFLRRRAPGQNAWSTPRKEADLAGISLRACRKRDLRRAALRCDPQHKYKVAGL